MIFSLRLELGVVDDDFKNPYLINRSDSIQVKTGERNFRLVWHTINDHSFKFDVKPDQKNNIRIHINSFPTNPRTSYEIISTQTNLLVTTDLNSTVYLNGENIGTHIVQTLVKPGEHLLHIKHAEFGELNKTIKVNSQSVTEVARFNENPSNLSTAAMLLPGAGYVSTNRHRKAAITYAGLGALITNLIIQHQRYSEKNSQYKEWEVLYQKAVTSEDAIEFRENANMVRNEMQDIGINFNSTLIITAGLYLISTIDGFLKPRSGYKGKSRDMKIGVVPGSMYKEIYPELVFKYQIK